MPGSPSYQRRALDDQLDGLLASLAAVALEGPKAVGKTRTALQRARTAHRLDDPAALAVAAADPARLLEGEHPVLIDEWQRLPVVWDLVRRAVDDGAPPGSFLLTGSATPASPPTHSGAGRIVTLRMRPLSFAERLRGQTVSLADLVTGARSVIGGTSDLTLIDYTEEILVSGLPGIRGLFRRGSRDRRSGRDTPRAEGAGRDGTARECPAAQRRGSLPCSR